MIGLPEINVALTLVAGLSRINQIVSINTTNKSHQVARSALSSTVNNLTGRRKTSAAPLASYFRARKLNFEWGLWLLSLLWYLVYVNICKVGFIRFAEATERKTERKIAVLSLQSDVGQIHLMGVQQTKTEVFRGVRAFLVVLISDWHMQNNMRRIANNVLPFSVAAFLYIYIFYIVFN